MSNEQKVDLDENTEQEVNSAEETQEAATAEEQTESAQNQEETNSEGEPEVEVEQEEDEEKDEFKDKYIRLHAEFENFRRRTAKENIQLITNANAKLIEKLTEVVDNFERAFAPEHQNDDLEAFKKGMVLIKDQFNDILEDEGLEEINPVGETFDPNQHEALMQQPSEEIEEGNVVTVFQKGYKVNDKILKHAKVIVSSGKA